ncbi:hypothetical protein GOP47_0025340 [Adiantum capillus-veneris]|uniref:DNA excision repair protein ERCC-1 n=1 Tax=Adiantum capillus-veneris TaxID=13818 RepID=A0A9D4Z410_ADICA|nr:hypothetical protein GOP47_0025340 [Adiantum capillus-veneris]
MEAGQVSLDPSSAQPAAKNRVPIFIPSHAEVLQQSRPQAPPSLFRPSSSSASSLASSSTSTSTPAPSHSFATPYPPETFTEAFSFVKKTEFYSPPPAPPDPPPSTSAAPLAPASEASTGPRIDAAHTGQARNAILVSRRQQGNPMLKHIKNVRWIYADIVPDYLLGQNSCALYLSLRYHLLHPDYLYFRIRELLKSFRLRIVLCYVDVEDVVKPLHEVTKTALLHDCTLLCAWSLEECARYLETIKIYENKPADAIQERTDNDYLSRLTSALTSVRHINKTDVLTLGSTFGTLAATMGASMEELARCPGIGERKVKRLYDAFHEPFRRTSKQARRSSFGLVSSSKEDNESCSDGQHTQQHATGEQSGAEQVLNSPVSERPKVSVRKALDAAYAKLGARHNATKPSEDSSKEDEFKDTNTDG